MAPKKCTKCGGTHEPPRGQKCRLTPVTESPNTATGESATDLILAKLSSIEERLNTLENPAENAEDAEPEAGANPVAETVADLRQNQDLQRLVEKRLRTLGVQPDSDSDSDEKEKKGKKKGKSGRAKTASDFIKYAVEWPHFHVFRGADRKPAQYDDLTLAEFVFGYLAIVQEGKLSPVTKHAMLQHLQGLMMDAAEYSFEGARNCHAIVLQQLEQGRVTWDDTERLLELRRTYAQRQPSNDQSGKSSGRDNGRGPLFCLKYQDGRCSHTGEHQTTRGLVKHICAFCLRQTGSAYNHPEQQCKRKARTSGESKNDQD